MPLPELAIIVVWTVTFFMGVALGASQERRRHRREIQMMLCRANEAVRIRDEAARLRAEEGRSRLVEIIKVEQSELANRAN